MSSPEEQPEPATDPESTKSPQSTGNEGPTGKEGSAGNEGSTSEQAPDLPPIPADGTSAPSDPDRVFGRPPDSGAKGAKGSKGARAGKGVTSNGPGSNPVGDGDFEPERAVPYDPRPPGRGGYGADAERDLRLLRLRGRLALILGVGGLVFSVPIFPVGLALSACAIILGATTIYRSRSVALPAPGAKAGLIVGIAATVIAAIVGWIVYLFYDELSEWQECLSGANTRSGQEVCQVRFSERAYDRIDELLGR